MSETLMAGAGRVPQPVPNPGMEMMGWGKPEGRCTTVHTPLETRALVLCTGPKTLVIVLVELCFPAFALREAILHRLQARLPEAGLGDHELLLLANHTHAGPGGYSHDLFYLLNNPGFCPLTHNAIVDAAVAAVTQAWSRRAPARAFLWRGEASENDPVVHNRSPDSFARNRTSHPPLDRSMLVMRVDHLDGTPLGCVDWFAVHCTSVHSDRCMVHPDNKGLAARFLEQHAADVWGAPDFVALFAQAASGDVSPNWRMDRDRGFVVGRHDDDAESAAWNGSVQADLARKVFDAAPADGVALGGPLDSRILWIDMDGFTVDSDCADGRPRQTGSATVGLSFLQGTREGPGPLIPIAPVHGVLARVLARMAGPESVHGYKVPFSQPGLGTRGRAFGIFTHGSGGLPAVDDIVRVVRGLQQTGGQGAGPWMPNRMPVHIWRLGTLAVLSLPVEPTTHAGRLIRWSASAILAQSGVEHVIVAGYANSFAGYATTAPEYQLQRYEGGHTVHGQWTTAAYRTAARQVSRLMAVPVAERPVDVGPRPEAVPDDVLALRQFPIPFG